MTQEARHLRAVTITGARSTSHRDPADYRALFDLYLRPFACDGTLFYLGGAPGIDSLALLWLAGQTKAALHVAVPAQLYEQPADSRHAVESVRSDGRLDGLTELQGTLNTPGTTLGIGG